MDKDRQIEEMTRLVCDIVYPLKSCGNECEYCLRKTGEALYEKGYRKQSELTPCDVCKFNPPSSGDGKPCLMCPAQAKMKGEAE